MDDDPPVADYIENILLSWVKLYASFEDTSDICSLSDGKFFSALLATLPNFKLLNSKLECSGELNTANKVAIMKNISQSLIKYH